MNAQQGKVSRRAFCAASAGVAGALFGFNRLASGAEGENSHMITQIARIKMNKDSEAEAIKTLKELCEAVEKNEPGVLAYICSREAKKPEQLVFFEVYKDADALKAHTKTPHFAKLRNGIGKLFLLPIEVTRLDRIGGFARS